MDIVFASNNQGKIREVKSIFRKDNSIHIYSLSDIGISIDVVEDRDTFKGNALKKAKEIYEAVKCPVIAEDSGLCVDALNGNPGVYSHRYYGDAENGNLKLLAELQEVPQDKREAYYIAVMCYFDGERTIFSTGKCCGEIAFSERGENGFAYDKIFFLPEYHKTMAQLSNEEKNKISHRRKALEQMKKLILNEIK